MNSPSSAASTANTVPAVVCPLAGCDAIVFFDELERWVDANDVTEELDAAELFEIGDSNGDGTLDQGEIERMILPVLSQVRERADNSGRRR